jgi:quercetin dioxygenase-like cupin family protein
VNQYERVADINKGSVLGVGIDFLVNPESVRTDMAVVRGTMRPGTIIPLHSHPDPEIIYVLGGELEVYIEEAAAQASVWRLVSKSKIIVIAGGAKHAIRVTGAAGCETLILTRGELYSFFQELAIPQEPDSPNLPPTPEQIQKVFEVAARHSYWMASPLENQAIGLIL